MKRRNGGETSAKRRVSPFRHPVFRLRNGELNARMTAKGGVQPTSLPTPGLKPSSVEIAMITGFGFSFFCHVGLMIGTRLSCMFLISRLYGSLEPPEDLEESGKGLRAIFL